MNKTLRIASLAAAMLLLGAVTASACPACADLGNASAKWYANTTVLLTLLPLAGIGCVILWVRNQVLRAPSIQAD